MNDIMWNLADQPHLIHQLSDRLNGLEAALDTLLMLLQESGADSVSIEGMERLIRPLGQEAKAANALLAQVIPTV